MFSRKSRNAINIISIISVLGVATGTAALIIVLSVFNGFDGLLKNLYSTFDPDIKITCDTSKTFTPDSLQLKALSQIQGIETYSFTLEENALIEYDEQQMIATMKGVDENYALVTGVDSMIVDGDFLLNYIEKPVSVVGRAIAGRLNLGLDMAIPMKIHIPSRTSEMKGNFQDVTSLINTKHIYPIGVFAIQQDYDEKYIIVPLNFAREILEYDTDISAIEVKLKSDIPIVTVKEEIQNAFGAEFLVADRSEQHAFLFKVMRSEKWAIFMIMVFIVIIASFNIVGSLTMLIIDKKNDIIILQSLGSKAESIRKIFFFQGLFITLIGALLGLFIGGIVCWVQQSFGVISLGGGSYIIDAYPVAMKTLDLFTVFIAVVLIGLAASWFPVHYITRRFAVSN